MKPLERILVIVMGAHLIVSAQESRKTPQADPTEHWAFRPPVRPAIPVVSEHSSRVRNPVDAFIRAELEKRGLSAGPEAPKEVQLRRVYLDLIGLPPTRDEMRDYLASNSPDAYDRVVDRLLNSPQYGERWARHWMDIWRYADWYGRRHVPDVWNSAPQVWRWRDWIVRSLNADKGYDRMIVEMLAGDEAAPGDDEARVATGYLVRNWYALNPNQWMREVVEHTGKAFLGLTFNCAHCHDHKYDPITQRNYFQFRAFFEPLQVRQDWVQGEPDPGPFQKYEYSTTRKVVPHGMVSVFDENLDAKTFVYLGGDERNLAEGKPVVEPAMPPFLHGDPVKPQPLDVPRTVQNPGLKPDFQKAEIQKRERNLAAAEDALATAQTAHVEAQKRLTESNLTNNISDRAKIFIDALAAEISLRSKSNQVCVARAELESIRSRVTATLSNADDTASAASRAERLVAVRKAEAKLDAAEGALALLQMERALAVARRTAEGTAEKKDDHADPLLKKAQEQVATTKKTLETAQAALQTNSTAYTPLSPVYPGQSTGRRRSLANWMASRENPLTARVAVNHIWASHLHAPLVASVADFGRNGARPTHPELLDWLAVEFMEHGWSMKHLHRLIVTSGVYRQSSIGGPARQFTFSSKNPVAFEINQSLLMSPATNRNRDPENRFLWRMNPGQMEAEVLRDSILFVAGELDLTPAGYPLPNADAEKSRRRSLYFECFPEPNGHSQFAEIFDPPNPVECYRRTQTIVPQQALALTNSKFSIERSHALARRISEQLSLKSDSPATDFITAAYEQILARQPTSEERDACREFLTTQSAAATPDSARAGLVHVLFNHNDFVTIR